MKLVCVMVGLLGWAGLAWSASLDSTEAARAYLVAFQWLAAFPLGALAFLMIGHVTGGRWQEAMGPSLRAAAGTTPLLILAFLPLLLVLPRLFPWADPAQATASSLWQHRAIYCNPTGWALRGLGALLLWSYLAWRMQSWPSTESVQKVACLGLVAHLFLTGVIALDWTGSLDPHFRSSIFGLVVMLAQTLTAFALLTVLLCRNPAADSKILYAAGCLLLAVVMLATYLEMSQLVIFWMGNSPEETGWLARRAFEGWSPLAVALLLGQRLVPFLLLIWGPIKKSARGLLAVALLISVLSPLYFAWLVLPSFHRATITMPAALPAALAALGASWWLGFQSLHSRRREEAPAR